MNLQVTDVGAQDTSPQDSCGGVSAPGIFGGALFPGHSKRSRNSRGSHSLRDSLRVALQEKSRRAFLGGSRRALCGGHSGTKRKRWDIVCRHNLGVDSFKHALALDSDSLSVSLTQASG